MRSILSFLYLVCLLISARALAETTIESKPFFYQIEKDGKVSHILGSMHGGIPLNSFPGEAYQAFDQSPTVLFEADRELFKGKYTVEVRRRTRLENGETLDQLISNNSVEKLRSMFGSQALPELLKLKPWAINSAIGSEVEKTLTNQDGGSWSFDDGIDNTLLKKAKAEGKQKIIYLDNLADKINQFEESFGPADLDNLLSYPDPVSHEILCSRTAKGAYLSGDEVGISRYLQSCETKKAVEIMDRRTLSWMSKIDESFSKGDSFAVVGAGHLFGNQGVLTMLEKKGFKVTRITQEKEKSRRENAKPSLSIR